MFADHRKRNGGGVLCEGPGQCADCSPYSQDADCVLVGGLQEQLDNARTDQGRGRDGWVLGRVPRDDREQPRGLAQERESPLPAEYGRTA